MPHDFSKIIPLEDKRKYLISLAKIGLLQTETAIKLFLLTIPSSHQKELADHVLIYVNSSKELLNKLNESL